MNEQAQESDTRMSMPRLSIVAVFYNMSREAPRTLHSLSRQYQQDAEDIDYEIIAVDNGSSHPLEQDDLSLHGDNFRLITVTDAPPSPAHAINLGVAAAQGEYIGVLIDGARIASPGMVRAAFDALTAFSKPFVSTVGFHLGPDMQTRSPAAGYNQRVEDELLQDIDWKNNGYRMFERSALAGSSRNGWLGSLAESNLFFLARSMFDELGGYDERFDLPGGGFVNLDFYKQACECQDSQLVTLLGEATFHQIHGGIMTNRPEEKLAAELQRYRQQYREIRDQEFKPSARKPLLFGYARPEIHALLTGVNKSKPDAVRKYSELDIENARNKARGQGVIQRAADAPDSQDHRSFVGPDDYYDKVAALQFNVLTMLGMRESSSLLDIGCGALRGGRLFLPYLAKGHYYGLEPNPWLIESAVEQEVGRDQIVLKAPCFKHNDDFNLSVFDRRFDYMMAHSIFSHTGLTQFDACLASVSQALEQDGVLVATFVEAHKDRYKDEWEYPGFNHFCWPTMQTLFAKHGLHGAKLDWPHPLQTWFVVTKNEDRLQQVAVDGIDLLPDELVLTGHRFVERGAGRFLTFYRHWKTRHD
ncbi:MAG: methyltransferase [Oceanococcus sp.]